MNTKERWKADIAKLIAPQFHEHAERLLTSRLAPLTVDELALAMAGAYVAMRDEESK